MKYNIYYMDRFITDSEHNTGLNNVANLHSLDRNKNITDLHTKQKDYINILNNFKKDIIYKINRFDPSKLKNTNDIQINHLWFHYIFKDLNKRDYASILKICNINYKDD